MSHLRPWNQPSSEFFSHKKREDMFQCISMEMTIQRHFYQRNSSSNQINSAQTYPTSQSNSPRLFINFLKKSFHFEGQDSLIGANFFSFARLSNVLINRSTPIYLLQNMEQVPQSYWTQFFEHHFFWERSRPLMGWDSSLAEGFLQNPSHPKHQTMQRFQSINVSFSLKWSFQKWDFWPFGSIVSDQGYWSQSSGPHLVNREKTFVDSCIQETRI